MIRQRGRACCGKFAQGVQYAYSMTAQAARRAHSFPTQCNLDAVKAAQEQLARARRFQAEHEHEHETEGATT